jgi:hypothetical protein
MLAVPRSVWNVSWCGSIMKCELLPARDEALMSNTCISITVLSTLTNRLLSRPNHPTCGDPLQSPRSTMFLRSRVFLLANSLARSYTESGPAVYSITRSDVCKGRVARPVAPPHGEEQMQGVSTAAVPMVAGLMDLTEPSAGVVCGLAGPPASAQFCRAWESC